MISRRSILAAAACLLLASGVSLASTSIPSTAKTILDYPEIPAAGEIKSDLAPPASAFHAWQTADAEAQKVLASWDTEPLTVPWTRIQLDRFVKHKMMPTRGARGLALVHVAMYDALQIADQRRVSGKLAVSMAAAQVLAYLFPAEERAFDRIAFCAAARMHNTKPETLPANVTLALAIGQKVGQRVIAYGEADGAQRGWNGIRLQWYGEGRYYAPGTWQPTPPYFYYPPDEPFAPGWKTWVLERAEEFRPLPPAFGSPKFIKDLQELIEINRTLTPKQLEIAKFWVDGHGSVTPPGHWNRIAIEEANRAHIDDATAARLFAVLNVAMADAFIAAWESKYHYWTMRPVTAAKAVLNIEMKPAILTPPFPSYVSGHASFSGAAAAVLGAYFPARAKELKAMGEEAALSRLLGGIHYRHDNEDGLTLGRRVAEKTLNRLLQPAGPAPK